MEKRGHRTPVLQTAWISSSQGLPQPPLEVPAGPIQIPCGQHRPGVNAMRDKFYTVVSGCVGETPMESHVVECHVFVAVNFVFEEYIGLYTIYTIDFFVNMVHPSAIHQHPVNLSTSTNTGQYVASTSPNFQTQKIPVKSLVLLQIFSFQALSSTEVLLEMCVSWLQWSP